MGANTWSEYARFLHESDRYEEAIELLEDGLRRFPEDEGLRTRLGLAWLRQGDDTRAEAEFRNIVELRPDAVYGWINLGYVEFRRGRWEEAEVFFREALERDPRSTEALYNLGRIALRRGRPDQALRAADALKAATRGR